MNMVDFTLILEGIKDLFHIISKGVIWVANYFKSFPSHDAENFLNYSIILGPYLWFVIYISRKTILVTEGLQRPYTTEEKISRKERRRSFRTETN
jgi:hypothetical protein